MDLLPLIVFYNPDSIANILAHVYVNSQFRVTMDTKKKAFHVRPHWPIFCPQVYQFHEGLYYFDDSAPNLFNPSIGAYYFLITVQENKIFFINPKLKE